MRIAITGSSGLVGRALTAHLRSLDIEPVSIVRSRDREGIYWNPSASEFDEGNLSGIDAVVHLAGESIAQGRWTKAKKEAIRRSRVDATEFLAKVLSRQAEKPNVLVSASATGYYGDRAAEVCDESTQAGTGFLSDVCQAWENATKLAVESGIRVVNLRIGIVLSRDGGALAKMLLPFKLGMGGRVGDGYQYWSWIALEDLVGAITHCIKNETVVGPVNAVSPTPATNREFTREFGSVLSRPAILPMPAPALRLAMGEMADALLLASARVHPQKLIDSGYSFKHPDLNSALRSALRI